MVKPKKGQIKHRISWEEVVSLVDKICDRIKNEGWNIYNVYGIPRGGLIIAVMVSHRLKVPMTVTKTGIGLNTLIVDDIYDSGKTVRRYRKKYKSNIIACLYSRREIKYGKKYVFGYVLDNDDWLIFPWEVE